MTLHDTTTTFMPYISNVTWIDDNETLHYESSVLPQLHIQYVTRTTVAVSTPITTIAVHNIPSTSWIDWLSSGRLQIPLYATILLLAVVGNALVIMTLVQNRRMRTITNVFLLNLAVSDILLGELVFLSLFLSVVFAMRSSNTISLICYFSGVFCMPFTLVGTLLRDFVFGELMCKFIPYLQGEYAHFTAFNFQSHVITLAWTWAKQKKKKNKKPVYACLTFPQRQYLVADGLCITLYWNGRILTWRIRLIYEMSKIENENTCV